MVHFLFFCYMEIPDKTVLKHNKFLNSSESYAIPYFSQRLCRWVFSAYAVRRRHKPFNLHIFSTLIFFLYFLKVTSFTLPQQAFNLPLWVTTSTSLLKLHTGATQALTRARESWLACLKIIFVHYYCFSLFLVYGIKLILLILVVHMKKSAPKSKIDL